MKRSDLWDEPAVNGRLRAGFTAQQASSNQEQSGFPALGVLAAANRPAIEQALKKAIPFLIIAFLICVAAARGFSLMASHARMEDAVRQATELTSAMALAALEDQPALFEPVNAADANDRLQALTALATAAPDTDLLMIDTTGTVLAATAARADLLGRSLASVFPELTSARHPRTAGQVVETRIDGAPYQVSMHLVGSGGGMVVALHAMERMNAFWRAEVNLNVTLFAAMALLLLVVVYAYYTQISRAEATTDLMSTERRAHDVMLANGEAGLWSFTPANRRAVLDGSASAALGLGSKARELSYRDLLGLVHPDDRCGLSRKLHPCDDGLIEADIRIRQNDGHYVLFAIRAHAAMKAGTVTVSGAAIRVASDRHRALEAATRRAGMLETAFDALPQPLALWRKDGSLDLANHAFKVAYDLDGANAPVRRDLLDTEEHDRPVVVRRAHGDNIDATEIKTARGEWMQLAERCFANGSSLTVGTDITRFKEEQGRLQAEQERLREKVSAMASTRRKLELRCASLERAQERHADTPALTAGTETAATPCVSAEIRTSLTAVLGFSELMIAETEKTRSPDGKLCEYARHIHDGGKALHALVERLENKGGERMQDSSQDGPVVRRIVA
ncbi:UNVERIFIED_ORG: two-component system cell cycle sensor histidine kinase PleC [Martelella mediterranea]